MIETRERNARIRFVGGGGEGGRGDEALQHNQFANHFPEKKVRSR